MRKFIPFLVSILLSSGLAQTETPTVPETPPESNTPASDSLETPPSSEETENAPSSGESTATASNFRYSLGGVLEAQFGLNSSGVLTGLSAYTLKFNGSLGAEDSPTAAFSANLRSSVDQGGLTSINLGETVLTAYVGDFDLQAGNLLVNWGAVDVFGVVSTVNPQDFSTQERIPVPAVRTLWNISDNKRLEGIFAPGFTPSSLPARSSAPSPALPPFVVGLDPVLDNRPATTLENAQYGLRYSSDLNVLGGGDFSVSLYSGPRHTPTPSFRLNPTVVAGQFRAQNVLNYDQIYVLGADTNLSIGDVAVRAEAAFTLTEDSSGINSEIGNPSLEGTVQAEYTLEKINLTGVLNARWQKGEMGKDDTFGLNTAIVASSELNTRTTVSGVWLQSLTDGSGVLLPSLSYTLADGFKLEGHAGVNYGGIGSSFNPGGEFAAQVRVGLKLSF